MSDHTPRYAVVCLGGACIDRKYRLLGAPRAQTSNPARMEQTFGGVASNVALNLAHLGVDVALVSVLGDDANGHALLAHLKENGVSTELLAISADHTTAEYTAILDTDGNLVFGVSDLRPLEAFSVNELDSAWPHLCTASWVFADCNINAETLAALVARKRDAGFNLAIDAVSEVKVRKLPHDLTGVDILFLNHGEAAAYLEADPETARAEDLAVRLQTRGASAVVLSLGERGMIAAAESSVMVPAVPANCVDVTGAGDALIAGTLYRALAGEGLISAAQSGALLAALTVESLQSVRSDLSVGLLERERRATATH